MIIQRARIENQDSIINSHESRIKNERESRMSQHGHQDSKHLSQKTNELIFRCTIKPFTRMCTASSTKTNRWVSVRPLPCYFGWLVQLGSVNFCKAKYDFALQKFYTSQLQDFLTSIMKFTMSLNFELQWPPPDSRGSRQALQTSVVYQRLNEVRILFHTNPVYVWFIPIPEIGVAMIFKSN